MSQVELVPSIDGERLTQVQRFLACRVNGTVGSTIPDGISLAFLHHDLYPEWETALSQLDPSSQESVRIIIGGVHRRLEAMLPYCATPEDKNVCLKQTLGDLRKIPADTLTREYGMPGAAAEFIEIAFHGAPKEPPFKRFLKKFGIL